MVSLIKVTATSFKRTCVLTVVFSATDPAAGHCHPMPPLETSGHSWASLAQSLVGTLLLSPGSCCIQGFVCALQVSVSPVLWKFCNQILSSVPTGLQSQIPLGFSVPLLDPQIWKTVVGPRTFLTVWEFLWCNCFVGRLLGSSVVGLMDTSSKRAYATCCMTQVCCSQSPYLCGRPLLTHASAGNSQTLKGRSDSVSVGSLVYGAHKVLFEPSEHL